MAEINYTDEQKAIGNVKDGVVIVKVVDSLPGGVVLDVADWKKPNIPAGHPIYKDAGGDYKPLELDEEGTAIFEGDPNNADKVVGIVAATVPTKRAIVGMMISGTVDDRHCTYSLPDSVIGALKNIVFISKH